MNKHITLSLLTAFALTIAAAPAMADSDKGEKLFKRKCASCHNFEKHATGPNLKGVIGRKAGSTDFSDYKALAGADFVWDEENMNGWIEDPKKYIGKATPMSSKIKKPEDRADIIEYVKSQQ